jgi:maltose alpha-D-glucosyltransferase/alpha-amylase/(1->4)-alpha-D-glucan 1-alpha-D-glucosylmutase
MKTRRDDTSTRAGAMTLEGRRLGSTYRLQLNGLGFAGAAGVVPFLHDLGVQTCYLSPVTTAMPGSTHGYDVIDPTALDPQLGGADGFETLLGALAARGMRVLLDIVPNHMAAHPANAFFADVLQHGRRSRYAAWFDIAWEQADGRIVLPLLGGPLRSELAAGRIRIERDRPSGDVFVAYGDLRLPFDPAEDDTALIADLAGADPRSDLAVQREIELLLAHQHYRLVEWLAAARQVNYRRFFAINELIGVRQEDPAVFAATHRLVEELAVDERVAGFRVDHVDGMFDPAGYLDRLRAVVDAAAAQPPVIVVEKILARDEQLPDWPVQGTTGYDVAAAVTGVLLDRAGAEAIAAEQAAVTGDRRSFHDRAVAAKATMLSGQFAGMVDGVARRFAATGVGAGLDDLRATVEALTAHLPVYRTYRRSGEPMSEPDVAQVRRAAAGAREDLKPEHHVVLDEVVAVLTGPLGTDGPGARAVAAWQQLTPAAVAKGVEDTATYDAGRLLAVCEVGAEPDHPDWSLRQWHDAMAHRQDRWPHGLIAGSTHDSKRSLDVRCRLAALAETADMWATAVGRLDELAAETDIGPAERRYLYQTLVGSWPVDGRPDQRYLSRIHEHVVKAAREASRHTSWTDPNEAFEARYQQLATGLLAGAGRDVIGSTVAVIEIAGATNSLAATVLAATAPGVPDTYQGDDLWTLHLVDPDNRAVVDWQLHRTALAAGGVAPSVLVDDWRDGRVKQHVLRRCLQLRRRFGAWWDRSGYRPLEVTGPSAAHVVASCRAEGGTSVVTIVPRLPYAVAGPGRWPVGAGVWSDTSLDLPGGRAGWTDVLTGREHDACSPARLSDLLSTLPVAVLVAETQATAGS